MREKRDLRLQFDPSVKLEIHGARISSDAGLLLFRELDEVLGLTGPAGTFLQDSRAGANIRHTMTALLHQAVFGRLAGYEEQSFRDGLDDGGSDGAGARMQDCGSRSGGSG